MVDTKTVPWEEHKKEVEFWKELWTEVPIEVRVAVVNDLYDFPQMEDVEYE